MAKADARIDRLETEQPRSRKVFRAAAIAYVILAVVPAGNGLFTDRPWLPAERIKPAGQRAITGYVLKADGADTVVLMDSPRRVVRLDQAPEGREYCWLQHNGSRINWWVGALLWKPASYPLCSELHP